MRFRSFLPVSLVLFACQETAVTPPAVDPEPPVGDAGPDGHSLGLDGGATQVAELPVTPLPSDCVGPRPGAAPVRLLTRAEYDQTVRDLLGWDGHASAAFPPENVALGFDNNAEAHVVSPLLVEKLADAAESIAEAVTSSAASRIVGCDPAVVGERQCLSTFVRAFGLQAFRRPLTDDEAEPLIDLATTHFASGGVDATARALVEVLLQSPQFLYRIQLIDLDETSSSVVALDGWSLASRLSYFLWKSMPDRALFQAAQDGQLSTKAQIEAQTRRMLEDPRAAGTVRDFFRQWLGLDALARATKDGVDDDAALTQAWLRSIDAYASWAMLEAEDNHEALFSSPVVFVDGVLAPHYGVTATELVPMSLEHRAGLLTQPALLAKLAHANQTSPIHRGIFVRDRLLCQPLPPPPPDVINEPPDPDPSATTRERFAQHTADPTCSACHNLIDPIGFGFEGYDELGRFRSSENGQSIDATGHVYGAMEGHVNGAFDGAEELAARMSTSGQVAGCVATQWYRYAMGRGESGNDADRCALGEVVHAYTAGAGDFTALVVAITTSDAFRLRPGTAYVEPPPLPSRDAGVAPDAAPPVSVPDAGPSMSGPPVPPIGHFDRVVQTGPNVGHVEGWALDPNTPLYALQVDVFVDLQPGDGPSLSLRAAAPRADVNRVTGHAGDHGFSERLPIRFFDGQSHQVVVIAYNTGDGSNLQLPPGPIDFTLPALPRAHFDGINANGVAHGWVYDPADPTRTVTLELFLDGPRGQGMSLGTVTNGSPRPDVNQAFGISGNPGFGMSLPATLRDGMQHTIHAYLVGEALELEANGSPKSFTLNPRPLGSFDSIAAGGTASGWAFFPPTPTTALSLHFYVDGPAGSGTFAGTAVTSYARPDVNQAYGGIMGDFGWDWPIPMQFRDGAQHTLHVYAINPVRNDNPLLGGSPKTFTLSN